MTMVYCFWYSMVIVAQDSLWCSEKVRLAAVAMLVGLIANVILNWICIPLWGLHGAVLATTGANAACLIAMLSITHRQGWPVDRGLASVCAMPIVLLLGPTAATSCWILLMVGVVRYEWVFAKEEKVELAQYASAAWHRILAATRFGTT